VGASLRVAAVIDGLGWGGAEMLLADFAVGAASQDLDLAVAYLEDKDDNAAADRLRGAGIEPVPLDIRLMRQPSAVPILRRHLARVRPDIVHTHLGYSDLLAGAAARSLGLPSVSTLHVTRWDGRGRERLKLSMIAAARRRFAQRVITVSEATRRAYLATGSDRPDRVVTVHNGVAGNARPGAGVRIRRELGLDDDDVVLVMVTVLRPGKGHDRALAAVAQLRRANPHVRLVILGSGPSAAEIAELARPLGDGVVLTGHRDDVLDVLDAADVLVHPTEADAFPTALLEAMAARVPVVATAVGGIPEIVEDGVTGILLGERPRPAELAEALRALIIDPTLRGALGDSGRTRFHQEFTAARWAERTRAVYERVLETEPMHTGPQGRRTRRSSSQLPVGSSPLSHVARTRILSKGMWRSAK
jgi:glycosyltransferase involved in cell wall biosynthesis